MSGGQTGVDRGALDAALELGLAVGGWCPAGRLAEDGPIADRYPLRETPLPDPRQRTLWNVRDSDATLILAPEPLAGGTRFTARCCRKLRRPLLVAHAAPDQVPRVRSWLARMPDGITLNVAGPRETQSPGAYRSARSFLHLLFGP